MRKTIHAQSGHTLHIESVKLAELPADVQEFQFIRNYRKHYIVKNWDGAGVTFFYIATDHVSDKKNEFVTWYRHGGFWSGFGSNLTEAINGAQKDGWMYA